MDIDEFLDRESASMEDAGRKAGAKFESPGLEHPYIADETKKYFENNGYFNKINLALGNNDFATAEKLYDGLWAKLSGDIAWNQNLHGNLMKIGNQIKDALNKAYSELSKKRAFARDLINKARENIAQGNHQAALVQYSELTDLHNEMPPFLFGEKRQMHNEILALYMELKEKIDSVFLNKFSASLGQIRRMINNARYSLKNRDLENAGNIYLDIFKTYTNLPAGFLSEKISIANDVLELYKEISISLEIKALERQLGIEKPEKFFKKPPFRQPIPQARPETGDGMRKREAERLMGIQLQAKNEPKKPKADAIKRLSAVARAKDADLKNLLIKRRLDRARLKANRGFYDEAKKDFESVLRLDPDNEEAKSMINKAVQG